MLKIPTNAHKLKIHRSIPESFSRSERTWTSGLLKTKQSVNSPWLTWQSNPFKSPCIFTWQASIISKLKQIISHWHQSRRGERLREGTYLLSMKSRGNLILQLHSAPIKRIKIAIAIPHCTTFIFSPSSSLSLFLDQDNNSREIKCCLEAVGELRTWRVLLRRVQILVKLTAPVLNRDLSKYIITIVFRNNVRPPVLLAESKN